MEGAVLRGSPLETLPASQGCAPRPRRRHLAAVVLALPPSKAFSCLSLWGQMRRAPHRAASAAAAGPSGSRFRAGGPWCRSPRSAGPPRAALWPGRECVHYSGA